MEKKMEIKSVSIIGLGGLGVLFGHHMSKNMSEKDLRIIADRKRIDKYETEGVYCNGELCKFHYMEPNVSAEPADLVIFAVKYQGLKQAIEDMKNQIGQDTIILSLLNGISSEGIIGETYGTDTIIYSVAQGMDAVKTGNKLVFDNMGMICFGHLQGLEISEKVKAVDDFFNKVEIPHIVEKDMNKRLWGKFMLNVGVNQTVAVYEADYGTVCREGEARTTMVAAMREVSALSKLAGVHLKEEDLEYWLHVLTTLNPKGKPSMAQDVEAKRYTEVDLFAGTVIELGKKYGIPTPVNKMLYEKVKKIESSF